MGDLLRRVTPGEVPTLLRDPVDPETLRDAAEIVEHVRRTGEEALRHYGERFGELEPKAPVVLEAEMLKGAFDALPEHDQQMLERTAARIRKFAEAQRASLDSLTMAIPGGEAGQLVEPMETAGCYAPGGRFPLPSSVMMTVVTARAAGVEKVFVASPNPAPVTLAAAYVAGADFLLPLGGAHAIAAMAYGIPRLIPRADVVVGPGNRWVTAAKKLVSGAAAIDMLAGPSELVIYADDFASPKTVAADLLAQAEHDTDAFPALVTPSRALIGKVNQELEEQLAALPTKETASGALKNGFAVFVENETEGVEAVNRLAPEHLELLCRNAPEMAPKMKHYGALFVGEGSAEVLGDYGAGPNHTLPTGGTARFTGGLSVFHFLRIRTWMRIDDAAGAQELVSDAIQLARHEGLEGHARSAELRSD